jgi:hypothetical protein
MEQVELLEGGAALAGELGVRVPDPAAYDVFAPLLEPLMGSHSGHTAKLVHCGRFGHGGHGGRGGHGGQARDRQFNRYIFVMCVMPVGLSSYISQRFHVASSVCRVGSKKSKIIVIG